MRRIIISGMIGNTLEWYDYALYGYFASVISKLFFPLESQFLSLMATFGVFAAGFVMRPIGAALFGYIGDRYGRRQALSVSVLLMAIPTACIGLLPTYAAIGVLAPILLTVIRLLQGLALGGEFSGSMTFIVEHSPYNKRGIVGSSTMFSMVLGMLCGSLIAALLSNILTQEAFETWGWRMPFLISFPAGIIGFYIRTQISETPQYLEAQLSGNIAAKPIKEIINNYLPETLIVMGVCISLTVPFYTLTVFMNSFLVSILEYSIDTAMIMNTLNMLVLLITIPLSAFVSDKIGRKSVLLTVAIGYLIFIYPLFMMMTHEGWLQACIGQLLFAVLVGSFIGPIPAMMVELFPTRVRYTGMALSYNLSISIFGGTAPILATWLITKTGLGAVFALYIMFCALISIISLCFYVDNQHEIVY